MSWKNTKITFLITAITGLAVFQAAQNARAGNLDSPGSPGATMYNLADIYNRLNTNATADEGDHLFSPSADPASSFHTLKEIYDKIPTILPEKVKSETSYLGITGTLLPNGGTADAGNVLSGKTFFGNNQTDWNLKTGIANIFTYGDNNASKVLTSATGNAGTYLATNLNAGTVKSTTTFGVGLTGDYPSTTYPLSGDTGATDAAAAEICNTDEAWTKAGVKMAGTLNPTADAIGVGNTYCGLAGTLLKNQYNGSAGDLVSDYASYPLTTTVPGFQGGVDDYNNNKSSGGYGVIPTGAYAKTWTNCASGDNCGTNDATYADHKDDSTGLVWSKWLDIGTTHTWFWANNCYEPKTAGNPGYGQGGGSTFTVNAAGTSYTAGDNFVSGGTGTGLKVTITVSGGAITGATVKISGSGYTVADVVTVTGGNGNGKLNVATIDDCILNGDDACICAKKTSGAVGCESIGDGHWRTPTQKELMQAYIDGSWGNLSSAGNAYWSSTTASGSTQSGWGVTLYNGATNANPKTNSASYRVRCVR